MRKIIYSSNVDITLGKGPSVNELEFIDSLLRCDNVEPIVLIPKLKFPLRPNLEGRVRVVTRFYVSSKSKVSLIAWEVISFFNILKYATDKGSRFIFRISVFPLSLFFACRLISGRYHIKTIGDGAFRYLKKFPLGDYLIRINQLMYKVIVNNACSVDMVTEMHKVEFSRLIGYKRKCHVIDNKVNNEVFYSSQERSHVRSAIGMCQYDYLVGYIGNDPLNRGGLEIVKAIEILRQKFLINVGGIIVGEISKSDLMEVRSNFNINNIKFVGHVQYSEIPFWMSALDVGVSFLPKWHRGASEQKVRQYLACGVPAVVTPGGSEFVAKAGVGFVVENDDLDDVSYVIYHAILNSKSLSAKCRLYSEMELSHTRLAEERLSLLCKGLH